MNWRHARFGNTVLHVATSYNNLEAVKLILAEPRFVSANALTMHNKSTALSSAVFHGYWSILKQLVHHPSIDLDMKQNGEMTIDDLLRFYLSFESSFYLFISGTAHIQFM